MSLLERIVEKAKRYFDNITTTRGFVRFNTVNLFMILNHLADNIENYGPGNVPIGFGCEINVTEPVFNIATRYGENFFGTIFAYYFARVIGIESKYLPLAIIGYGIIHELAQGAGIFPGTMIVPRDPLVYTAAVTGAFLLERGIVNKLSNRSWY